MQKVITRPSKMGILGNASAEKSYAELGYIKIQIAELYYPMDIFVPELMKKGSNEDLYIYNIRNAEDIVFLQALKIQHTWVLKDSAIPKRPGATHEGKADEKIVHVKGAKRIQQEKHYAPLGNELRKHKDFFRKSYTQTRTMLDSVRQTGILHSEDVVQVLDDITSSVAQNPSTLLCMRGLQGADEYTYFHSINVALFSSIFAQFLGYNSEEIWRVGLAGLLHDVGKQKIPLTVLNAKRKLTDNEFSLMKQHPELARDVLESGKALPEGVLEAVVGHHEKFDGSGYPNALKGDEIHQYAQILALADTYDALTSERPYKRAFPQSKTAAIIYSQRGIGFSEEMVDSFIACFGVYPIGSLVHLNTGAFGIVYENNSDALLFPKILCLAGSLDNLIPNEITRMDLRETSETVQIVSCEGISPQNINLQNILLTVP